jgi:amino-acid N-acetyltransferase
MSSLRPANQADVDAVCGLLAAVNLPTEGVKKNIDGFVVYEEGSDILAAGGLERHGKVALLRSVVVDESLRGKGLGTLICDCLERVARDERVHAIYLLTESAASFFCARGYEVIHRSEAPGEIKDTEEFTDLCPASAVLMRLVVL